MSSKSTSLLLPVPVAEAPAKITEAVARVKSWSVVATKPGEIQVSTPVTLHTYGQTIIIAYADQDASTTVVTITSRDNNGIPIDLQGNNDKNLALLTALLTTGQVPAELVSLANTPPPSQKQKVVILLVVMATLIIGFITLVFKFMVLWKR